MPKLQKNCIGDGGTATLPIPHPFGGKTKKLFVLPTILKTLVTVLGSRPTARGSNHQINCCKLHAPFIQPLFSAGSPL